MRWELDAGKTAKNVSHLVQFPTEMSFLRSHYKSRERSKEAVKRAGGQQGMARAFIRDSGGDEGEKALNFRWRLLFQIISKIVGHGEE